jgi:hypothetical protein
MLRELPAHGVIPGEFLIPCRLTCVDGRIVKAEPVAAELARRTVDVTVDAFGKVLDAGMTTEGGF